MTVDSENSGKELPDEDGVLLVKMGEGDLEAQAELWNKYYPELLKYATVILKDRDDAHDLIIKTWDYWLRLGAVQFDPEKGIARSWMFGSLQKRTIDVFRERGRQVKGLDRLHTEGVRPLDIPRPGVELEANDNTVLVQRALELIDPLQAEPLRLSFLRGKTNKQIAEVLGVPLGTVKTRIRNGKESLRVVYEGLKKEDELYIR